MVIYEKKVTLTLPNKCFPSKWKRDEPIKCCPVEIVKTQKKKMLIIDSGLDFVVYKLM